MDVRFGGKAGVGRTGWVKCWGGGGQPGGCLHCQEAGDQVPDREGALENDVRRLTEQQQRGRCVAAREKRGPMDEVIAGQLEEK